MGARFAGALPYITLRRTSAQAARASVKDAEDGKGGVEEADGIGDEEALL
jgi:hypothetical protein